MADVGISFTATLFKIATETSGGWRVQFDIPESESESIMDLSKLREQLLQIAVIPITTKESLY